ncbi:hypothetical protein ZOSMA_52G00300 [Zostera marina]|uniref:RRM domain-containing protein n=1 Tax=Zostera marina TaxID=29655 RepID=A0A0K9NXA2_ZOSMR|nr:hypothetical protein ZOSMA_52G00300 [Zostera marina]
MAFANKFGNLIRHAVSINSPSMYQALRCMSSSKIFVGGIPFATDEQGLRAAFTDFGEIIEARVIMDRDTGRSRGFGFVSFTSSEEASAAISGMDGKDLQGRFIRVNYATDRRIGGGYSGGGYVGGGGYGGGGGGGGGYGGGGGGGYGGGGYGGGPGGRSGGYGGGGGDGGGYNNFSSDFNSNTSDGFNGGSGDHYGRQTAPGGNGGIDSAAGESGDFGSASPDDSSDRKI